jgi:hypothetical protein
LQNQELLRVLFSAATAGIIDQTQSSKIEEAISMGPKWLPVLV